MKQKVYYEFVNIVKLLLAISVVAMHCALVPDRSMLMLLVCRLAVPYFFLASGFFLKRKIGEDEPSGAVKGYLRRLLLPFSIFSIVWIAQMLVDDAIEGLGIGESILGVIQSILFFPRGALWYVWASILGVVMLYPFLRKRKLIYALPVALVLYIAGLLANNYYFLANGITWLKPIVDGYLSICLTSNNAPFVGFVFLLIGMLISEYDEKLAGKRGVIACALLLAVSGVLMVCEAKFIWDKGNIAGDGAFYVSQLVYVPAAFFLSTKVKCPHFSRGLTDTAKWMSTGIYFLHVPVLWIMHRIAEHILPRIPGLSRLAPLFDHAFVCFACCLVICVSICLLAYRYPNSSMCRILK